MKAKKTPLRQVLVIHGPNLNMLGTREPEVYGRTRLAEIDEQLEKSGRESGLKVVCFQSNHEGAIVDKLQAEARNVHGLIINPAAFTHTSIAIRDALSMLSIPMIEVHISNIHKRESFRRHSMLADVVTGQIVGLGVNGYYLALQAIADIVKASKID